MQNNEIIKILTDNNFIEKVTKSLKNYIQDDKIEEYVQKAYNNYLYWWTGFIIENNLTTHWWHINLEANKEQNIYNTCSYNIREYPFKWIIININWDIEEFEMDENRKFKFKKYTC